MNSGVRRTAQALLASALGAVPLCQLLTDRGWLIDVWLSMAVVIAPALLLRLRRPPGAFQVWPGIALLVPWLTLRFAPTHALLGLVPTGATMHDLSQLMDDLHHTTHDETAPVHSTVAVRLALCAMLGLFAALIDLIAVVGRHAALATVPLLVVFTVSGAVPRQPVDWWWFALTAAGFLLLLCLDAPDEISGWGHRVARPDGTVARRAVVAVSGQRIAVVSIAVAVLLPLLAPVTTTNFIANLVRGGGQGNGNSASGFGGEGGGSLDPFAALRGQLQRDHRLTLFSVTVNPAAKVKPFYLRENVLSTFTGSGWTLAGHGADESLAGTDFGTVPATPFAADTVGFDARISISGLTGAPPVFTRPDSVDGLGDSARWNPQDQLLLGGEVHRGLEYHEAVIQGEPTPEQLQGASSDFAGPSLDRWLELPAISAEVRTLVARITAGKDTPYARARAISDYFSDPRNGFSYSLSTGTGTSGDDLVDFLRNKIGYCQQYAAAMGVMLRLARVPARVVLGYTHPVPDSQGTFTVTTDDAHSWVEAYFGGIGWVPFDPTPLAGIAGGSANDLPWAPHGQPLQAPGTRTSSPGTPQTTPHRTAPRRPEPSVAPLVRHLASAGSSGSPLPVIAAVLLGLLVLALVPAALRVRVRRIRLRAGRRGDADQLWAELSDTATDLGYVWSEARTPRQVAGWLSATDSSAAGALQTLARAVEQGRYAPAGRSSCSADLVHELATVRARLSSRRGRSTRVGAWLWPASLRWTRAARWSRRTH